MASKLRALFVAPHLLADGPTRFVLDVVEALVVLGIGAEVFSVAPPTEEGALIPHGMSNVAITYGAAAGTRVRYAVPAATARLLASARNASIVVASNEVGPGHVGAFFAGKALGKPTVAIAQNNLHASLAVQSERTQQLARWEYPRFDAVACVSEGVVPSVLDLGVPPERVWVINNGVNLDRVRTLAQEPVPDWVPRGPYMTSVGSLTPSKGFDLLIEAHARVRPEHPHDIVILGEGPERTRLEAQAAALGVADSVHMPGFVQNPFPIIRRGIGFCMPSRFEGMPLALVEALGLGAPIIAADCVAGPREVLDGGRYGALLPVEDVDALAAALASHLSDQVPLTDKAAAATRHLEDFTIQAAAGRYADLLANVVDRAPVAR